MEHVQLEALALGEVLAGLHRAADLACAREEDEHVAVEPCLHQALERGQHLLIEVAIVVALEVLEGDLEAAALAAQAGRVAEPAGDGRGVERGRHHHQLQIGPAGPAAAGAASPARDRPRRCRSWNSSSTTTPTSRSSGSPTSRRVSMPSVTKRMRVRLLRDVLEADLVADGLADALAQLLGDAHGGQAGGEAARLEHDDLLVPGEARVEERGGDAGGLAGAGRRLEHQRLAGAQRTHDVGQERVDGQRSHGGLRYPQRGPESSVGGVLASTE